MQARHTFLFIALSFMASGCVPGLIPSVDGTDCRTLGRHCAAGFSCLDAGEGQFECLPGEDQDNPAEGSPGEAEAPAPIQQELIPGTEDIQPDIADQVQAEDVVIEQTNEGPDGIENESMGDAIDQEDIDFPEGAFESDIFVYNGGLSNGNSINTLVEELVHNGRRVAFGADLLEAVTARDGEYRYNTVILRQPNTRTTEEEVAAIQAFVNAGHRVLLLASNERHISPLLQAYDINIGFVPSFVTDDAHYVNPVFVFTNIADRWAEGVEDAVVILGVEIDAPDATPILTTKNGNIPLGVVVESDAGGEFIVLGSNQLSADAMNNTPGLDHQVYTHFHLFDNCQLMLNLLDSGTCSADEIEPEVSNLRIFNVPEDKYTTEFDQPNGAYAIHAEFEDVRGVWRATYRINGGHEQEMFAYAQDSESNNVRNAPAQAKRANSGLLTWGDLEEGENIIEVAGYDRTGNVGARTITVNRQTFAEVREGRISIEGLASEGEGIAASGRGHATPRRLSSVSSDAHGENCSAGTPGPAFYTIQTRDIIQPDDFSAGAHGVGIDAGFNALDSETNGDVTGLSLHFERLNLGEDERGSDWDVRGDTEFRRYGNPGDVDRDGVCENLDDCSKIELRWNGEVMLQGSMGTFFAVLDHNKPNLCADDFIGGSTSTITDMALHPDADQTAQVIGEALLEDIGDRGICLRLANLDPIVRRGGSFDIGNGTIDIGDCD